MAAGLLFECDDLVASWIFGMWRSPIYKYDRAIGLITPDSNMVGALLFQNWNGPNVELSYYGKNILTAGIVRAIARYTLKTFNPARLTVITSKRNRQFMRALQKLGFRLEGTQRCYYGLRDSNKNTGVRFVAFREAIERVAKLEEAA